MIARFYKGAKFQYRGKTSNDPYTVTVEDITITSDGKSTEVKIFFSNSHGGPMTYCMSPEDFCSQLGMCGAKQIA